MNRVNVAFTHDGPDRDTEFDVTTCKYLIHCGATDRNTRTFFETIDRVADGAVIATVVRAEVPDYVYEKILDTGLYCKLDHDGVRFMEGVAHI